MIQLFYITNKPEVALVAEAAGVDRIFVDLETIGKAQRQGGMDTVQSRHNLDDVRNIREVLGKAKLLVRSNPIHQGSKQEIDTIIRNGADYVMLPYFKTVNEVAKFIDLVGGRAKTIPLVETKEAVEHIDAILDLEGIDEIYIGLNDLHLSYGMKFMFELLTDGTVDNLASKFKQKGLPFGFGGIAKVEGGLVPGKAIIKEHYRVGSTMAILSRSFCNADKVTDLNELKVLFKDGIKDIRELEKEAWGYKQYFETNRTTVIEAVQRIIQ